MSLFREKSNENDSVSGKSILNQKSSSGSTQEPKVITPDVVLHLPCITESKFLIKNYKYLFIYLLIICTSVPA